MNEIAARIGINPNYVSYFNSVHEIRSPEKTEEIRANTVRNTRSQRRKKIAAFSPQEKVQILAEHQESIRQVSTAWWKSPLIKQRFGTFETFEHEINSFVRENLDYFDPQGWSQYTNKPFAVRSWILHGVWLFCRSQNARQAKRRERTFPENKEGQVMEFSATGIEPKRTAPLNVLIARIPVTTRNFLRTLGFRVERVAEAGFSDMQQSLLEAAKAPETALTADEKRIVDLRLHGKTLEDIGKITVNKATQTLGVSREAIRLREQAAVVKIKKRLKEMSSKAKSD